MRTRSLAFALAAAPVLAACGDSALPFESIDGPSDTPTGVLSLDQSSIGAAVGDTIRLRASLTDANGLRTRADDVEWRTVDASVAVVEDGLVIPLAPGTTRVVAASGSRQAGAAVASAATAATPNALSLPSAPLALRVGETAEVNAALAYSNGLKVQLRSSLKWTSLNPSVATVSNGVVTAKAAGSTKVVAQLQSMRDTMDVTVAAAEPAPAPAPEPAPGTSPAIPAPLPSGRGVELPRATVDVSMPAVTGRTIRVAAGQSIQAAVDAAVRGDEIVLEPGVTYTGTVTLRRKSGAGWITIRSAGSLPASGTRVTPAHAAQMPRLVTRTANTPAIRTEAGASHYRLIGLEVTADASVGLMSALVSLGDGSSAQNSLDQVPHHLVLDRMYVHGHPTLNLRRCVAAHVAHVAIVDSWLSECHSKGSDSQAILATNGPGPFLIENNHLAGAGENIMFGGDDSRAVELMPRDITIRRNHFYKPVSWKGVWTVKNLLELKVGQRVLVEGNVFENNWADGQVGFAILFKSVNQSGRAPWSETSDVTFRYNVVRQSGNGLNIAAAPESYPAVPASRIRIEHSLFEDIGVNGWGSGRLMQFNGADDVQVENVTGTGKYYPILFASKTPMRGFVVRNSLLGEGTPLKSAVSTSIESHAPDAVVSGNVFLGATAAQIANFPGNLRTATSGSAAGVDRAALERATRGVVVGM